MDIMLCPKLSMRKITCEKICTYIYAGVARHGRATLMVRPSSRDQPVCPTLGILGPPRVRVPKLGQLPPALHVPAAPARPHLQKNVHVVSVHVK